MSHSPEDPTAAAGPDSTKAKRAATSGSPEAEAEAADRSFLARMMSPLSMVPIGSVQKFGRSLMLPIAVLPVAALLNRLGQPDMMGVDGLAWGPVADVVRGSGEVLFEFLPLLFAIGIAIGMAKKSDGSTALAALIGYLVYERVSEVMAPLVLGAPAEGEEPPVIDYGVLAGIVIGLVSAWLWQRYHRIKLPPYLAFFGGRRFVPMLTALAGMIIGVVAAFPYPAFDAALTSFSEGLAANTVIGGFVYGMTNRLLIPTGLHHILNNFPWFMYGSYETEGGRIAQGEIDRFISGDPTAGAFLTGVTEPLEFAFMFVAWPLYLIHAFLTGTAIALVNFLDLKMGFGFSAGLFDMLLNWRISTGPQWIVLIGLGYAVLYYVVFRFAITKWKLKTPGREEDDDASVPETER